MASLRPGRCYSKPERPNTRIAVRVPKKSYVKGVPAPRIHQFEVGQKGDYPLVYHIVSGSDVQIRSNSLEAARVAATKYLTKNIGEKQFFLKVRVYPHHVLRENPLATGAGADRFSTGMRKAFGKPIGQAAIVSSGQKIISVYAPEGKDSVVKEALRRAAMKLPGSPRIVKENN
ncbi:MAG: 50S ribosomal protein L16 [Candidatus Micrarchaeota archaeon]|nr:50S ribosomal protein L16 [Candidatus Micrarchaeota archaeon]